ncbi:hypothetical protein [Stenoxybacter acetivorans]|uniref:hypothetical protein n=1 Tax=Stenoxybacter acetivorans TaxID=422441 RepID=UPI00056148F3|nr:hypothetical protein [Stenoxybacter acetivorans]
MSNSIQTIYQQSLLALASYAENLKFNIPREPYIDALADKNMAERQASSFVDAWKVIDQYTDASGVSATVFESTQGTRHLAIRGSESPGDYNADFILAVGFPSYLNPQFIQLQTQVRSWIDSGALNNGFTVSGHSLGGYLAAAVGTWFAEAGQVYTYNAPGLGGPVGNIVEAFRAAFGLDDTALAADIINIRGTGGISVISGLGAQLSPPILVETETSLNPLSNHSIGTLSESLAIYALFNALMPTLTIAKIGEIIQAAVNINERSLEYVFDEQNFIRQAA